MRTLNRIAIACISACCAVPAAAYAQGEGLSCAPSDSGQVVNLGLAHDAMSAADRLRCPQELRKLKSDFLPAELSGLCETYTRYHAALAALQKKGIDGTRIANVVAPRFVDTPDWQAYLNQGKSDPQQVYDPAPQTWNSWDSARAGVDAQAALNAKSGHVAPIDTDWIRAVHVKDMNNLPRAGDFRTWSSPLSMDGFAVTRASSLPYSQIQQITHMEYPRIFQYGQPLVSWVPTQCFDQWSASEKRKASGARIDVAAIPRLADPTQAFTDQNGVARQCGYVVYPPTAEVSVQLQRNTEQLDQMTASWSTDHPDGDPILAAARAQRWFVAVHPFEKGNGRTSRFLMDYTLESVGLPAPILAEQNDDVGVPEKAWAKEVGQGMLRTIQTLEACEKNPAALGCQVVPSPTSP